MADITNLGGRFGQKFQLFKCDQCKIYFPKDQMTAGAEIYCQKCWSEKLLEDHDLVAWSQRFSEG